MKLEEFAPAKINLTLGITGRRDDGYHLIDSIFAFTEVGDRLWAEEADELRLVLSGPRASGLAADGDDNLVLKAARVLRDVTGTSKGAVLQLEKLLPLASGIGGGSADAAAALRALNRLWGLGLDLPALADIGLGVGADVPAAVYSVPLRVRGIGERLLPLPSLPDFGVLLVNPGVAVPTPAVFQAFRASGVGFAAPQGALPERPQDVLIALRDRPNMLEGPAIALQPAIATVLARLRDLPGARLVRMSGSGATCFAIFDDRAAAKAAVSGLSDCDKWWIWAGGLLSAFVRL